MKNHLGTIVLAAGVIVIGLSLTIWALSSQQDQLNGTAERLLLVHDDGLVAVDN